LNSLKTRKKGWLRYGGIFDIDSRLADIEDKEQLTLDPTFWNTPKDAEAVLRVIKTNKKWCEGFLNTQAICDDLEVLFEFQKEGEATEEDVENQYVMLVEAVEDLEFRSTLNRPEDELGCTLEINAGAGGTESCDWSAMLLRMYQMWAKKSGFKMREIHVQQGDVAGIQTAEIEITGDFVYGMLKGENGVHRLVRVSPFNSQGKRMTSFSSVFVHPILDDRIEIVINPSDLEWDTYRAQGAGGQHVNKTESAVRATHIPTGFVVTCQEDRSQIKNRERALVKMKALLYEAEIQKQNAERDKIESGKTQNEWGSQIRSYVLDDRRVKDHRTGHVNNNTDAVLDGNLDSFLKAFLMNATVEASYEE
jgi:peptide chain release factor 2